MLSWRIMKWTSLCQLAMTAVWVLQLGPPGCVFPYVSARREELILQDHLPNTSLSPYSSVTLCFRDDGFPQDTFLLFLQSQDTYNIVYWHVVVTGGLMWVSQEWYLGKHILLHCCLENRRETKTPWPVGEEIAEEGWTSRQKVSCMPSCLHEEAVTPLHILSLQ